MYIRPRRERQNHPINGRQHQRELCRTVRKNLRMRCVRLHHKAGQRHKRNMPVVHNKQAKDRNPGGRRTAILRARGCVSSSAVSPALFLPPSLPPSLSLSPSPSLSLSFSPSLSLPLSPSLSLATDTTLLRCALSWLFCRRSVGALCHGGPGCARVPGRTSPHNGRRTVQNSYHGTRAELQPILSGRHSGRCVQPLRWL